MSKSQLSRELTASESIAIAPGVLDVLTAKLMVRAGTNDWDPRRMQYRGAAS